MRNRIFTAVMSIEEFLTTVKEIENQLRWMSTYLQIDQSGHQTTREEERLIENEMIRIT